MNVAACYLSTAKKSACATAAENARGLRMRNRQLIRQWKILQYLAKDDLDIDNISLHDLSTVLNVSSRTICRDFKCLYDAGFIPGYRLNEYLKEKKTNIVANLVEVPQQTKQAVQRIYEISNDAMKDEDLLRCNRCKYKFKLYKGEIDMKDFRAHKASCAPRA